jgi:subtilisin family serine protease
MMRVQRIGLVLLVSTSILACNKDPFAGVFPSSNQSTNNSTQNDSSCAGASLMQTQFIVHWKDGHVSVENSENAELFKKRFLPQVEEMRHVEFDQAVKVKSNELSATGVTPIDFHTAAVGTDSWGPNMVQASAAWSSGVYGQGVLVGVVDAAVQYAHPQINPRLAQNTAEINGRKGVDDDGNGFVDDMYGWDFMQNVPDPVDIVGSGNDHGTHVSGIIAADSTRGPVQGMAPQAKIIPANFMDATGGGSLGGAIKAIQYVASRGARVINASWGGPSCSVTLGKVITDLAAKNIVMVVASGNDGLNLDVTPDYPANFNFPNMITVAASNMNDYMTNWSNSSFSIVHVGAPGDTIYSTVPGGAGYMSGTSMAAPSVSGAAALLLSAHPKATYAQLKQALISSVDARGFRVQSQGRINVAKALQALQAIAP